MKFVQIKSRPRFIFSSLILFVSLLMSTVQGVKASSIVPAPLVPLATAYPTLTPIISYPTSVSLDGAVDFSCPAGLPFGYGTLTPSVDWRYSCSQCLPTGTSQAFYTSTPGPTHTPSGGTAVPPICVTAAGTGVETCYTPSVTVTSSPTATASPTFTPTPVTSGELSCNSEGYGSDLNCTQINSYTLRFDVITEQSNLSVIYNAPSLSTVYVRVDFTSSYAYPTEGNIYTYRSGGVPQYPRLHDYGRSSIAIDFTPVSCYVSGYDYCYLEDVGGVYDGSYTYDVGFSFQPSDFLSNSSVTAGTVIYVSSSPIFDLSTPTPTFIASPTPGGCSSSSYCGCVSNQPVPNQFEFGGGNVVHQECISTPEISLASIVDIFPSWITPTFFIFLSYVLPDFVIDPLTVCIRTRDYGLYIFGYRMPMEFIIGLVVFLSGLRFFVPTVFSGASVIGQNTPTVSQTTSVSTTSRSGGSRTTNTTTTRKKG